VVTAAVAAAAAPSRQLITPSSTTSSQQTTSVSASATDQRLASSSSIGSWQQSSVNGCDRAKDQTSEQTGHHAAGSAGSQQSAAELNGLPADGMSSDAIFLN